MEAKVLDMFKQTMQLELPQHTIERFHRVGRAPCGKPKAIIIKFSNYKHKDAVFRNKETVKEFHLRCKRSDGAQNGGVQRACSEICFDECVDWRWAILLKSATGIKKITSLDELSDARE